jgi:hypothetical protein
VSCYEAGYDGFWLHRLLVAAGITNYVFDPSSIAVDQRARRVKTDRIDGERMLRTLMAYLRGEPRVVRIVRVPWLEERRRKRAHHCLPEEWWARRKCAFAHPKGRPAGDGAARGAEAVKTSRTSGTFWKSATT